VREVDIAVVGAGFAGLACATALAGRGYQVVVLERKRAPGQAMHTTGILVKEAADRLELPPSLVRRVAGIRLYSPKLRVMELTARDYFFLTTDTPGLMVHFSDLAEQAGVELRYGDAFRPDAPRDHDGATGAAIALPRHGIRCRWLLGADAPFHRGSRLGLGRNRAFLAGVEAELEGVTLGEADALHCFLDSALAPGYLGWAIPGVGVTQVGLASRLPRRPDLDLFLRRVGRVFDLGKASIVARRGGLIPVGGVVRPFARGRVLLLGDAAGTVSPLTAGGIHTALHYADLLADAIDAFETRRGPDPAAVLERCYPSFRLKRRLRWALEHLAPDWAVELAIGSPPFRALARAVFYRPKRLPEQTGTKLVRSLRASPRDSPCAATRTPMIDLHYWPTPNGKKVSILLEECGLPYKMIPCRIGQGDQFSEEFLDISPNNRMPALVDHEPLGGGEPVSVFESGAMMIYIAEKAGQFYPSEVRRRAEVNQWVMWQMANQGPKLGECGHFRRLADREGDQSYALRRFGDEANRLYGVMNNRLHDRRYLAGDEYTIADMIAYPWAVNWETQGQDITEFPYFERWLEELGARPAVQRGMAVGSDLSLDPDKLSPEELARLRKLLYNQRARPAPAGGLL
jgi:GST-like protein